MLHGNFNLFGVPGKNYSTTADRPRLPINPLEGVVQPPDFTDPGYGESASSTYGYDDIAGVGGGDGATSSMNYNNLAYASILPALGRSITDLVGAAEKTPLRLANFNNASSRFNKMNANLTQAKQDILGANNSQKYQIDQTSTGGLRNARLQAASSSYRDILGRVGAQEQQLRNRVLAVQGQAETRFAVDNANRTAQNDMFNEQNRAATRDISRQAAQNIYNIVGKNANARQMFEDIQANNLTLQKAATAEGFKFLNMMAKNFGLEGSEEYQSYLENPTNETLQNFLNKFNVVFKQ